MSHMPDPLLQATADAAPSGLYRLREDGFILEYASRGYRELTGYSPENVKSALLIVHPADREQVRRDIPQQIALHPDHSYDLEYRLVHADGTVLHVNDRGSLMVDGTSGVRYLCGLLMNISDTYMAQQRLQAAQEELLEANRAKNDFLAHMSHEIRTPIHAVSGLADLLLLSGVLPSEPYAHAMGIKSAAQTLMYLVNDILDFSKIAAGRMPIIQAPFHTLALLDDLCTQARLRARGKPLTLHADIDPALPRALIGDELRLKQVLLNLLINAVKFTDKGKVTLSIHCRSSEKGVQVDYAVEDTGVGISQEDQRQLFEHFRQMVPARDRMQEGTGLGLAISRQLVRLMGGDITVESRLGQGSRFTFSLSHAVEDDAPVARVEDKKSKRLLVCSDDEDFAARALAMAVELGVDAARARVYDAQRLTHLLVEGEGDNARAWASAALPAGTHRALMQGGGEYHPLPEGDALLSTLHMPLLAAFLNNELARHAEGAQRNEQLAQLVFSTREANALIVDDNPANLLVGSSLLRLYGLEVREASSGRQALELVSRHSFDIVFMDHMMPEMDGLETVRALRAQQPDSGPPVVVLTANLPAETREMYHYVDIQGVLTKPLELGKLSDMLLHLLPEEKIMPGGPKGLGEEFFRTGAARAVLGRVPLLDYDDGMLHCAGDEALYLTLLFTLCQDLAEKHALLERALAQGELPPVALCAHSLKSALYSIGCPTLAQEAQEIEGLAKHDDGVGLKTRLPSFAQRISEFRADLHAQLQRLPRETQIEFTLPAFDR